MNRKGLILLMSGLLVFGLIMQAEATVLDFNDNLAAPPGFYALAYYNNYTANRFRFTDPVIGKEDVADIALQANVLLLRPVYYFKLWNRTFAVNAVIPYGSVRARNYLGDKEKDIGVGDIAIGPGAFLYENPDTGTFLSFWEFANLPVGSWSKNRALRGGPNMGLHYWYFQHQLAFAQLFAKGKISYDMNLNYFQRLKEPSLDVRYPDTFEVEAILGYGITDQFRVGVYADYWNDLNDIKDKKGKLTGIPGKIPETKRKFFSIGPSLSYGTEKWAIHFRLVPDVWVENSPKGWNTWLRFFYAF